MDQDQTVKADFESKSTSGLTGLWSGTITTTAPGCVWAPGPISWNLTQTGSSLTGTFTFSESLISGDPTKCSSSLFFGDTFQGSVTGNTITLNGASGEQFAAAVNGNTITGTGTVPTNASITYTLTFQHGF
jgi:hypothetical protein